MVIRASAQTVFETTHDRKVKEHALIRIFKNLSINESDAFKTWYNHMLIERLRNKTTAEQKRRLIGLLENAINNSHIGKLKAIVDKFNRNGRLYTIKKRFLSTLLSSQAGRVALAFKTIRGLPPRVNLEPGFNFFGGLIRFINNRAKATFEEFKKDNLQALLSKRNAALLMIKNSMSSGKKAVEKWHNEAMTSKMYDRCRRLTQFMETVTNYEREHVSIMFSKRQYDFKEIKLLHRLFVSFGENTGHIIKDTVNQWKSNVESERINPWYKRGAYALALNSTVSTQISFWRLKENMSSSVTTMSAVKIVRLKKMFNNIRKAYELVIAKSFWSLYHGKKGAEGSNINGKAKVEYSVPATNKQPVRVIEESRPVAVAPNVTKSVVEVPKIVNQELDNKLKQTLSRLRQIALRAIVTKETRKIKQAGCAAIKKWIFKAIPQKRI